MRRRVLDSNKLIQHWHRSFSGTLAQYTPDDARRFAGKLNTNAAVIVTPVYLELVAGTRSGHELTLTRAYLSVFRIVDDGHILDEDWVEARRLAERIPHNGQSRHTVDCLIRAICNRLNCDLETNDRGVPP